jgi:hypothetical protein
LIESVGALALLIFICYTVINAFDRDLRLLDPGDEGTMISPHAGDFLQTDIAEDPRTLRS